MNTAALWQEFLKIVHEEEGSLVLETWFKALLFIRWDAHQKTAFLQAPNTFVREWIEHNYIPLCQKHLRRLLNEDAVSIVFVDAGSSHKPPCANVPKDSDVFDAPLQERRKEASQVRAYSIAESLMFDNYVVGPHNSLAFAAAHAITEQPGMLYNPLIIYGPSGYGKTHLLHAIGNKISSGAKKLIVLYQTAERFINEFIQAVRANKMHQFHVRYKQIDVLLFDDIQAIAHKEQTQEAFYTIFTSLYQARKQIVCSSTLLPHEIEGLGPRMKTRLEGGLIVDVQAASLETRIVILQKKAHTHGAVLSDLVAHFIASRVTNTICELEGALIRVLAFSSLTNEPISVDLAQRALWHNHERRTKSYDLETIAKNVALFFDYSLADLKSERRQKDLVLARHVAIHFMKKLTQRSLREISACLHRKDHSTVLHALEKIENIKNMDPSFATLLQQVEHRLYS